MRTRSPSAYGKDCIEEEYSLRSPRTKISMGRGSTTKILRELSKDILEGGREWHFLADRESEPICLPGAMIWILPKDDHTDSGQWAAVERCKNFSPRWEDLSLSTLFFEESPKLREVWRLEFRLEGTEPRAL